MMRYGFAMLRLAVVVCTALMIPATGMTADMSADMLGLKLGMTPEEAMSVLKASRPDFTLKRDLLAYTYSDGVQDLNSPEFVSHIIAENPADPAKGRTESEQVILTFNQSAINPRLLMVGRTVSTIAKPVSNAAYKAELFKKYGAPSSVNDVPGSGSDLTWNLTPGDMTCYGKDANSLKVNSWSTLLRIPAGVEASQCPAQLSYQIYFDPVTNVRAVLIDVQGLVKAESETHAWVKQMEEGARAARGAKGEPPKL